MRKSFISLLMALCFFTTTLYTPKANALVGLVFKNRIIKVIGGIGSAGGATLGVYGYITAASSTLGGVIGGVIFMVYGIVITGVGLIILDDNQTVDLAFTEIDLNKPENYKGFSFEEVSIYNSELEQLNAIRKTIASEISESEDTSEAEALWYEYSYALSPATIEIAEAKAKEFIEHFKK